MYPTSYPDINALLETLRSQLQAVLGDKLIGLYLFGSLVTSDFDFDASDIDLLAAISTTLDAQDFAALDAMQNAFIAAHPEWRDRLEIAYLSLDALKTFKMQASPIGIISPGEPFHIVQAGKSWLVNWYVVRENGVTLFGPPPQTIIAPISIAEYVEVVKDHVTYWREWLDDVYERRSQAYAILTLCRALYTVTYGDYVSKPQAALWAAGVLPEWSDLILNALLWRQAWRDETVDHAATLPEMRRFIHFMLERIEKA